MKTIDKSSKPGSTRTAAHAWALVVALVTSSFAGPASAQWTRVADIPETQLFSVWTNGDTVLAGADTAVYMSTNAGASFARSAKPAANVVSIQAVFFRNGRLYAGTFGQGVFVSDDRGATWSAFNQGLVGGFLDSQLDVVDLQVLGDVMYAATAGSGAYARDLSGPGTWLHFGNELEPNQASTMNSLALGGTRLMALAGGNGQVFDRDPADADWRVSNLDNAGIHAGVGPQTAIFTGSAWMVGTNIGLFRSVAGEEPWQFLNPGLGPLNWTTFATSGGHLFVAFDIVLGAVLEESSDNGATFQNPEGFGGVFVFRLAVGGPYLYAARADGLWRRPSGLTPVAVDGGTPRLRFTLAGAQPCREQARLRFELPDAGSASIQLFDVLGRVANDRIEQFWSAGSHDVTLDTGRLSPGVYTALLTAAGGRQSVRLVHVR